MQSDSTQQVEYRPIKGFLGYRVGDDGSVWSCWKQIGCGNGGGSYYVLSNEWHILKLGSCCGYKIVSLQRDGKGISKRVHRLVLEAFDGPCPPGMQACHFPYRDKTNNNRRNLRWATPAQNQADRIIHGTDCRGEKSPHVILSEEQAKSVFQMKAQGMSHREIALQLQVSKPTVKDIYAGRTWKHLRLAGKMPAPS